MESHMDSQIETLTDTLIDTKPPYIAGTSSIPDGGFILFYGKGSTLGRIHLAKASEEDLQRLTDACEPATFGVNQQDVLDESYRKAGKLNADDFSTNFDLEKSGILDIVRSELLMGHDETKQIEAERYKLNVYGKDSFFKAHKDTPREEKMFGSIVIVFPTTHEGGSLFLRHDDEEWELDSAKAVAEQSDPCVAYVAFYSDVEHEVALVKSGYRVTLTYNLYFSSGARTKPALATSPVEIAFTDALRAVLEDPEFLPDGGYLGFGLFHEYPTKNSLKPLIGNLKGLDAVIENVCKKASLKATLKVLYDMQDRKYKDRTVILDRVPRLEGEGEIHECMWDYLREYFGAKGMICGGGDLVEDDDVEIWWVTDVPDSLDFTSPFIAYGNEAQLEYLYGTCSLIVSVGPAASRATM